VAIFNEVALIIFEILFMILGLYQKNGATSAVKENFSYYIIYYMTAVTVPNVIYFVFRTVVHVYRKVWIPFTESELFRKNFPEKWARMQAEKSKEKKITKGIDPMAKEAIKRLLKGFK
jgi:cytochrome b subunit of formate dehydrogenase